MDEWVIERQRRIKRLEQLITEPGKYCVGLHRKIARERAILTLSGAEGRTNATETGILARFDRAVARSDKG